MQDRHCIQQLRRRRALSLSEACGFTLVEMTVVLVVIGLVLGAVTIGKDVQRNADYLKIKQFVDRWAQAYDQYFDRVGVVVGDDPAYPARVVNFLGIEDGGLSQLLRGSFDPQDLEALDQSAIPALCGLLPNEGPADEPPANRALRNHFIDAGIDLPPGRRVGHEDKYLYLDSRGTPQQLTVCFQWLLPADYGVGNSMILRGLTPDLARMLDAAIDGRAEGTAGRFRRLPPEDASELGDWPEVSANGDTTVSAAYRMTR